MAFWDYVPVAGAVIGKIVDGITGNSESQKNRDAAMAIAKFNAKQQERMFDLTNAYNTPMQQRKRMMEAGFNPAAMYGHGTVANVASMPNMPDAPVPPEYKHPLAGLGSGIADGLMQYQQAWSRQQTERMNDKDLEVKDAQILSATADVGVKASQQAKNWFDVKRGNALLESSVDASEQLAKNIHLKNTEQAFKNANLPVNQELAVRKANMEIQEAKSRLKGAELDRKLKAVELDLKKNGVENAPWWVRSLFQGGKDFMTLPSQARKGVKDALSATPNYSWLNYFK